MKINQTKMKRRDFLRFSTLVAGGLALPGTHKRTGSIFNSKRSAATLQPNPLLGKLGFSDKDRVLITQVDDVGVCEATMAAYSDLVNLGMVTTACAMPPCIWFPLVAHYARTRPDLDLGVQLTLTSEWDTIRWRPISTVDPASGLLDAGGYFPKTSGEISSNATAAIAIKELEAQILRAQSMGVRLTHIDSHQGISFDPRWTPLVIQLAQKYQLPLVFLRPLEEAWKTTSGIQSGWISDGLKEANQLEQQGYPLLDSITDLTLTPLSSRFNAIQQYIKSLSAGVHLLKIHAAISTPEIKAMTLDWAGYVADYSAWIREDLKSTIQNSGIKTIGWAPIKALL